MSSKEFFLYDENAAIKNISNDDDNEKKTSSDLKKINSPKNGEVKEDNSDEVKEDNSDEVKKDKPTDKEYKYIIHELDDPFFFS